MRFRMGKTTVRFDRERYLRYVIRRGKRVLERVAKKLQNRMKRNLVKLSGFPSEWRAEMVAALDNKLVAETENYIEQAVGLLNLGEDEYALIRAKILEHGTGFRGNDNDGYAIWHWQGVEGLNSDVTGMNLSNKASFPLPDEFNMYPGSWFADACELIEEEFDEAVEQMWQGINPWDYIKMK